MVWKLIKIISERVEIKKRRPRVGGDPDSRLIPAFLCKGTGLMPGSPPTRGRHVGLILFLLAFSPLPLLAEHTVYIPPVFVRGAFFDQWLEPQDRAGISARWRHEHTLDPSALGRFLGPDGKSAFTIGPRYVSDVFSSHLIHGDAGDEHQSVSFAPSSVVQKADLTLWGNVTPSRWVDTKQLVLFANLDAASVVQHLNAMWQPIENKRPALEHDYQDFFEGRYSNPNLAIRQANLGYQKFNNRVERNEGLSSLSLGAVFQHELEDTWLWRLQGLCSIPCCEKNSAEFLFKPRRSVGRHYGIGAAVDLKVPLWRSLYAMIGLRDMFWLSAKEARTVGIKGRPFSFYQALGRHMQINEPVTPAANILTQECLVQPGHTMMMNLELRGEFSRGHHVFVGWHGTYKEAEKVALTDIWPNSTYAVVHGLYDTRDPFMYTNPPPPGLTEYNQFDFVEPGVFIGDAAFLQHKDLDFSVSGMPSFFEHNFELGWESLHAFGYGQMEGGPRVVLGCRAVQGENAHILPNIFTCEIGLGLKF